MSLSTVRSTKILLVDTTVRTQVACSNVLRERSEKAQALAIDFVGIVRTSVAQEALVRAEFIRLKPDIVILELKAEGSCWTFLENVLKTSGCKTIVVCDQARADLAMRARSLGAIEVWSPAWLESISVPGSNGGEIATRLRMVIQMKVAITKQPPARPLAARQPRVVNEILAIAASTGGTEALKTVLSNLPSEIPATVIVQHMPPLFTGAFAAALNQICPFEVKEAEHGDAIVPGRVLIAPGDYHMEIVKRGAFFFAQLHQANPMHGVRPAADYLMKSVAKYAAANSIGVVLTGMGKDGAQGLLEMRKAGALTFAQDEKTSIVYGMPKEAFEVGAVGKVLPLSQIAPELALSFAKRIRARAGRAS